MLPTQTPTFLIELPLQVDWTNEKPLRAHLEAARCLYDATMAQTLASRAYRAVNRVCVGKRAFAKDTCPGVRATVSSHPTAEG